MNNGKAKALRKAAKQLAKEPTQGLVVLGNRMLVHKVGTERCVYQRLKAAYKKHQITV